MKARVKATGEIIDVIHSHNITSGGIVIKNFYKDQLGREYSDNELEFLQEGEYIPDYWTRLEHQAAIGAMQAYIIASHISQFSFCEGDMKDCKSIAHALVEKLKKESK